MTTLGSQNDDFLFVIEVNKTQRRLFRSNNTLTAFDVLHSSINQPRGVLERHSDPVYLENLFPRSITPDPTVSVLLGWRVRVDTREKSVELSFH